MTFRTIAALAATLCALAPGLASAEDQPRPNRDNTPQRTGPGHLFDVADGDGDGKLTLQELQAKRPGFPAARFTAMDKNGDGVIERSELSLPQPQNAPANPFLARIRAADTDQDQRVSKAEFSAAFPKAPEARFASLDRNGDGFIDQKDRRGETNTVSPQNRQRPAAKASDRDGANAYLEKLVAQNDTDQDGRVTLAELTLEKRGFPADVFGALDRNKDGVLTAADATTAPRPSKKADKKNGTPEKKAKKDQPGKMKQKPAVDQNQDGKITFEELKQANPKITKEKFDARDKNGDGVLTKEDRQQN